jgi:uncharacterized protein YoxC
VFVLAFEWSDVAYASLSVFLLAVGLGLGYAFLRLAGTLGRLSSLIRGTEKELLPILNKVGGSVDRVNGQLDKVDLMTDSAVDAVENVDSAVRAVSFAVRRPVQKLTGLAAGVSHGAASLKVKRDWREALRTAKEAAARRERDLEEELRVRHEG